MPNTQKHLKKTKTKIVGAICTLTYSVTRFFRCSKCEASPRYSIIAIHSVLKNNMFFKLIYDLKALYMIMHFGRSQMF